MRSGNLASTMKVNLLYDKLYDEKAGNEGFFYEKSYTFTYKPINFSVEECIFDYHLPIEFLINKYYPNAEVRELSINDIDGNTPCIYQVSFKFLAGYFRQNTIDQFYRGLPEKVRSLFENAKCLIILNDSHEFAVYNSIIASLNKNSLIPPHLLKNIIITSGNPNNQQYRGKQPLSLSQSIKALSEFRFAEVFKHSPFSIYGYRYFEEAVAFQKKQFYSKYSYRSKLDKLKEVDVKLGICLNRVYRNHRLAIAYLLHKNNLHQHFLLSHDAVNEQQMQGAFESEWKELISREEVSAFAQKLPLVLDSNDFTVNHWNNIPFDLVEQSFLWLITETICDNTIHSRNFFTEKIYKPISLFMPFIIIGQPRSLYNLKLDGYKTFDKWWDESYDNEPDPIKRMVMIMEVLKKLATMSNKALMDMYTEMNDVLEHNNNKLIQATAGEQYIRELIKKYNYL